MQTWELWYPKAASTGLLFARGRLDATDRLLVHAAPDVLSVEVRNEDGTPIASGTDMERRQQTPISRLTRKNGSILREDLWPTDADLGLPVILPGGEVGILKAWWHAGDHKEWRWQIELYNSLR